MVQDNAASVAEAILKVPREFLFERIVYLVGVGAGILMLLYLVGNGLIKDLDLTKITAIFGSGGVIGGCSALVLKQVDRTMNTIKVIVMAQISQGGNAVAAQQAPANNGAENG